MQIQSNIWWEDVNNIKRIREEGVILDDFERLLKEKYLFERYYDDKVKEFYELKMGSMIYDEYTRKFLDLLRCVPYIKDDKAKI